MNENAQNWVEALESGEYAQGEGWLCADGAFCCLGVACDLAVKAGVEIAVDRRSVTTRHGDRILTSYGRIETRLPRLVMDWLGLASDDGCPADGGYADSLMVMNDGGKTFAEIAAVIRSEPPGLFREDA